jgi:hypothetical protein
LCHMAQRKGGDFVKKMIWAHIFTFKNYKDLLLLLLIQIITE